jgi:antitoxin HicB
MPRQMTFAYPANFAQQRNGSLLVTFPDLPEARTEGRDRAEAMLEAEDCLAEAIAGRIVDGEEIPTPSRPAAGQEVISLDALIAAKAALYARMRELHMSKSGLAAELILDEKEVRRMLDPRHKTRIERIERALALLGKRLAVTVSDAA